MSFTQIESFDFVTSNADLVTRGWYLSEGIINATSGRFGGYGYALDGGTGNILSLSLSVKAYITASFWFKTGSLSGNGYIYGVSDVISPTSTQLGSSAGMSFVYYTTDGKIHSYGDASNRGSTAAGTLLENTWQHIEIQTYFNNSGYCKIYVDGVLAVTANGDYTDSYNGYAATSPYFVGDSSVHTFDDIVIRSDNSVAPPPLGEHRIHGLVPNSDTAQADFTGSYADIDDPKGSLHDDDGTVISSDTLNAKSEFGMETIAAQVTAIHGIKVSTVAKKTDGGVVGLTPYVVSNSARGDATELGLSLSYGLVSHVWELDPDTSLPFTKAAVDNLLVGVEITSKT